MFKIAAMGDRDSIIGFKSIGIETFFTDDRDTAIEYLKQIKNEDYATVFVTEMLAEKIEDEIEKFASYVTPSVILIPGVRGNTGKGMENISSYVEKAVGSDILS